MKMNIKVVSKMKFQMDMAFLKINKVKMYTRVIGKMVNMMVVVF